MNQELSNLRKQLYVFKSISIITIIILLALGFYVIREDIQNSKLLVTEGIIIQDTLGNDRILIGSPLPYSSKRVRADSAKAWETYIAKWPEERRMQVWDWFKGYNHTSNGIVILSESGYDRIAIGDPTPDPVIGKRIAPGCGFTLMDDQGYERGGMGVMNFDGKYRVTLGLDSDKGSEGITLMVDDDGFNGLFVPGTEKYIFLGNTDTSFFATQPYAKFNGLIIRNKDSILVDIQ